MEQQHNTHTTHRRTRARLVRVQKKRRGGRDERVRQKRATTMPTTKDEIEEENEIENVYTNEYYTRMSPSSCDWSEENTSSCRVQGGPFVLLIVRFIVSSQSLFLSFFCVIVVVVVVIVTIIITTLTSSLSSSLTQNPAQINADNTYPTPTGLIDVAAREKIRTCS